MLVGCDNVEERYKCHNHEKQIKMQTENKNINFPRAKAGAEVRQTFYPTIHFFNCDSLVFERNAELEILFWRGGGGQIFCQLLCIQG